MCKAMEDMRNESMREVAKRMLAIEKLTLEEIAECVELPVDEVKSLKVGQTHE